MGRTLRRLAARVGGKKAAMAVAQKIVVIIDPLLLEGTLYEEERYERLFPRQEARERQRALKAQPFQHADLCAMSLAVETCLPF